MIGLYIAYTIPVFLRWRMGDDFKPGPWTLGKKYKWINLIAIVWVAICVVIFCLPFTPAGVPWNKGFTWSSVNYAPLVTIGVMIAVTIWYLVSARKTFKGPIRTIDRTRGSGGPKAAGGGHLDDVAAPMSDTLAVIEPATEAVLEEIPRAGVADVDAAVARARAAFPAWRALAPADRAALLRRLADALADELEELALLEARNAGKPIARRPRARWRW